MVGEVLVVGRYVRSKSPLKTPLTDGLLRKTFSTFCADLQHCVTRIDENKPTEWGMGPVHEIGHSQYSHPKLVVGQCDATR
mmetsp:Transcript_60268/g.72456  ORF Transcript_60268/g.72456 Transcript_60268/m.72456 type:complete len:81 (-) Transcript_60268:227-469(-)